MFDFFLKRYKEEEKNIIEELDRESREVQRVLGITSDPIKQQFLRAFTDFHKYHCFSNFLELNRFKEKDMVNELNPLFAKVAEKVVTTQKCDFSNLELDIVTYDIIFEQLKECGIVTLHYSREPGIEICVKSLPELNKILAKTRGKSLLSIEHKIEFNKILDQRRDKIIGEHKSSGIITIRNDVEKAFWEVVHAFDSLSTCDGRWVITSSADNKEMNTYAKKLIDREWLGILFKDSFNYLTPNNFKGVPHFYYNKISYFIYPEYLVAAQSATNFEVILMKNLKISFSITNFVEEQKKSIPKDAKLVGFTHKYINKNGERDARYKFNPQYPVYEYGNITFDDFQETLQFSNSDLAYNFFKKVQLLKQSCKENKIDSLGGITQFYFDQVKTIVSPLCDFYDLHKKNETILKKIDQISPAYIRASSDQLYRLFFLLDLVNCFEQLGHDSSCILSKDGLPMALMLSHMFGSVQIDFESLQEPKIITFITKIGETIGSVIKDLKVAENTFLMNEVFKAINRHDFVVQYYSLLYRFFSVVAKADDKITPAESRWLEKLMSYTNSTVTEEYTNTMMEPNAITNDDYKQYDDDTNPLDELRSLIGLYEVKDEVTALANFVRIQKEREKIGLIPVGLSYHCVFTGNPGTGKTTVARILAAIYKNLGILKKGHLVETDRSGLVAEYVGQTAVKTNKIIDSALDGVLFIDEAYSLVQGGGNDYGQEAISTLLKRMEDDRNRLVVVLAGYSEEMKQFIDSNPGLQSRFSRYIHFADYTSDELEKIFMLNVKKNQYKLDESGCQKLNQMLRYAVEHKDKNFGNGRFVRNMFERTIQNQATRLSKQAKLSAEELSTLTAEDLPR